MPFYFVLLRTGVTDQFSCQKSYKFVVRFDGAQLLDPLEIDDEHLQAQAPSSLRPSGTMTPISS